MWQAIEVTPRTVAFGRVTAEQAENNLSRKVTIVNNVEGELKLGELQSSNPLFKTELTPLEDGKKYELTVTLVPPVKPGNNTGKITSQTGLPDMPTLDISVYAFVVAPIEVSPPRITLNSGRTEQQTVQLYVRSNVNKPFQISELKASNESIKVELSDVKDAQTWRLKVDVPADYKPKPGDQITFATDDPAVPTISVPILEMNRPAITRPSPVTARPAGPNPAPKTFQPPASSATVHNPAAAKKAAEDKQAAEKAAGKEAEAQPAGH